MRISRIYKKYIPTYVKTNKDKINNFIIKSDGLEELYLKMTKDFGVFLHGIERRIDENGKSYKSIIKISLMLHKMLKDSRKLQKELKSIDLSNTKRH